MRGPVRAHLPDRVVTKITVTLGPCSIVEVLSTQNLCFYLPIACAGCDVVKHEARSSDYFSCMVGTAAADRRDLTEKVMSLQRRRGIMILQLGTAS